MRYDPVGVVGDHAGLVVGDVLLDEATNRSAEGLQNLALLRDEHALERLEVGGVHGEQAHELVHPLVHGAVERRKRLEVLADERLLLGVLLQQALGNDEGNIFARDADLLEAVFHASQRVGDELEARVVEEALLHAGDEAEPSASADLADLAQEVKVEDQGLLLAGAEVVEQLVDDEQQAVRRVDSA